MNIKSGDIITICFEGKEFQIIVIDPNGLGEDQPSVGFGFRMMERNAGIPNTTLSGWVRDSEEGKTLQLPSGMTLRVRDILGSDGNEYSVIEATDWFELAVDLLVNPGRTGKGFRQKLGDFLKWFAVKGFYAEAYVALKGVYTDKDSRATTRWLEARQIGKIARKIYTDLLQAEGCKDYDYANWTDCVYSGLFGMKAKEMKQIWELMDGDVNTARNYIPEARGLEAVAYCEDMTVRMFINDLSEAHDQAINLTKRKFIIGS
jgi:hypothetical protein